MNGCGFGGYWWIIIILAILFLGNNGCSNGYSNSCLGTRDYNGGCGCGCN